MPSVPVFGHGFPSGRARRVNLSRAGVAGADPFAAVHALGYSGPFLRDGGGATEMEIDNAGRTQQPALHTE